MGEKTVYVSAADAKKYVVRRQIEFFEGRKPITALRTAKTIFLSVARKRFRAGVNGNSIGWNETVPIRISRNSSRR
jgi:hypothetical protein